MTTSSRINPPGKNRVGSPQYQAECIFALEPSLMRLIELAKEAGWDEQQVVYAVLCITASHLSDRTLVQAESVYQ